jgi:hypothetical protein
MSTMVQPASLYASWCSGAGGNKGLLTMPVAGSSSPNASLADGFPIITMTSAGGVPMKGADMNGALKWVYDYCLWLNGGGQFPFDATYATGPGYAIGAVVQLTGGLSSYVNLAANNTNNPNSVLTNWAPWAGAVKTNVADLAGTTNVLGAALVNYTAGIAATYGANTVGAALYAVIVNAALGVTNAAAAQGSANTANTAIANLALASSGAVGAGMIGYSAGITYSAGTVGAGIKAVPPSLFAAVTNQTGSRALGGGPYTNGTGKPMFVTVSVTNGGGNSNLTGTVNGSAVVVQGQASPGAVYCVSFMVPSSATYAASISSGGTLLNWTETV